MAAASCVEAGDCNAPVFVSARTRFHTAPETDCERHRHNSQSGPSVSLVRLSFFIKHDIAVSRIVLWIALGRSYFCQNLHPSFSELRSASMVSASAAERFRSTCGWRRSVVTVISTLGHQLEPGDSARTCRTSVGVADHRAMRNHCRGSIDRPTHGNCVTTPSQDPQ